jgi:hypothetical protein
VRYSVEQGVACMHRAIKYPLRFSRYEYPINPIKP